MNATVCTTRFLLRPPRFRILHSHVPFKLVFMNQMLHSSLGLGPVACYVSIRLPCYGQRRNPLVLYFV